jgi:hypothetical protein
MILSQAVLLAYMIIKLVYSHNFFSQTISVECTLIFYPFLKPYNFHNGHFIFILRDWQSKMKSPILNTMLLTTFNVRNVLTWFETVALCLFLCVLVNIYCRNHCKINVSKKTKGQSRLDNPETQTMLSTRTWKKLNKTKKNIENY